MRFITVLIAVILPSCAGYHLGGTKPAKLASVHSINVTMFRNDTQHPRANAIVTSAVANALVQDGTYKLASAEKADAILEGTLHKILYSNIRSEVYDTMRPEELSNTLTVVWTLHDARNPRKVLMTGSNSGTSRFFIGANLQTDRNNALPDAADRAGQAIVSQLANGF